MIWVERGSSRLGVGRARVLFRAVIAAMFCAVAAGGAAFAQPAGDATAQTIAELQDRAKALQGRDDIDSAARERAIDTYEQAVAALESAQSERRQAAELDRAAGQAPTDIREAQSRQQALDEPLAAAQLQSLSVSALSSRADAINTRLAEAEATLLELRDQLTQLAQRPETAREELADARGALQALEVGDQTSGDQATVLTEAERALLSARRAALTAKITRLQQELSGLDSRRELLEARRSLAQARLSRDNESLAVIQRVLGQRQDETARTLRNESQDKLSELRTAVAPITDAAQRNVELAQRLADFTDRTQALADRQERQRQRAEDIQQRLNLVERQLEIGGGSVALGDVLRAQRRELTRPSPLGKIGAGADVPDIAAAELDLFQLQQSRAQLEDLAARVASIAQHADIELNDSQRQSLKSLLEQRRRIIGQLIDAESRFVDIGRDLRTLSEQYDESLASFNRILDERLFWLPSFAAIDLDWFDRTAADLAWVANPVPWKNAAAAVVGGASNRPFITAIAVMVIALLLGLRRLLRVRLRALAEPVGNVSRDTVWLTLRAALITVLMSMPYVLLLLLIGYLMRETTDPSTFTRAVGFGVMQLGGLMLFIEPFTQVCRKHGLAEAHFLWTDEARYGLYRILRWLLIMLALPTLFLSMAEAFDDDAKRETIGRLAFMLASLVIAAFSWRLLHPLRGALADVLGADTKSVWWVGYLWLPLAVGVPLLLFGLAATGYYYTALKLQSRFFVSAGLLGGCRILYSFILRWLTVAERRLALQRARRKRAEAREARAAREAAGAAGEGMPDNLDTLEIDMLQISEQTRGLIKIVIALLIGSGLWAIWWDTLPALQQLDNIILWQYSAEAEGGIQLTNVTLGALLLALAVGVGTALAGRNLPGFLEITLLRRFSMEAGSRYAMATLFKYAIVTTGLLVAVSLIGLRWSSIQWLVAAIGVGLGFGLQEIFANFVSGIVILFERPVRVGDTVTVGTLTGTVSRIRIRATTVTDWDNKEVVIPNKTFITETVINWTLTDDITRLIISVHLALDADTDLAEKLIMDAIRAEPVALDEPAPSVFFVGYDDSSIQYEARVFYHDLYNLLPLQHALYKRIHAALAEHNVVVSFPQRDLHLRSVDESFTERLAGGRRGGNRDTAEPDAGPKGAPKSGPA